MKVSDRYEDIVELVSRAEVAIAWREREDPGDWAMTAFSRYRVAEMLGIRPRSGGRVELSADPVALLAEAARSADQLVVLSEHQSWRSSLAEALRGALADVRMVCGARDV
ncbi:MAG TPA: hypothetical protein VGL05_15585 [Kribbella sp.]